MQRVDGSKRIAFDQGKPLNNRHKNDPGGEMARHPYYDQRLPSKDSAIFFFYNGQRSLFMNHQFINQLKENDVINDVYQITEKILRPNKNGNLYLQFLVSDRTGTLSGRFWNANEEMFHTILVNDFVRCEGSVQRFQGMLQFIAKSLVKVDPKSVDANDYSRSRKVDLPGLVKRLKELLRTLTSPDLMNLADCFLADDQFMLAFCDVPAGIKLHHAYPGGLLEHTVALMELACVIATKYEPLLDRDLLLMGAFLHDVGKTIELSTHEGLTYTDSGQLLGHLFLGAEILQEKIVETEKLTNEPFDPERTMILKHLILSHHGELLNGSCKVPMTREAIALYYIDTLDSKLEVFDKYILEDPNIGFSWTNYIPNLERKIYKGRSQE